MELAWFKMKAAPRGEDLEPIWLVVGSSGREYGPFSPKEILRFVSTQQLDGSAKVYRADAPDKVHRLATLIPQLQLSLAADKRQGHDRASCSAEITASAEPHHNNTLIGVCLDISLGGLFFEVEAGQLRPNQLVNVVVTSRAFSAAIHEQAYVIRRHERFGYGLRFASASQATIEVVTKLLESASPASILSKSVMAVS